MTEPTSPDPERAADPERDPADPDVPAAEPEEPPRPRKRAQAMGQSIGGVLFGFEQQVWRTIPPPHELVHHARPDDPLPAGDGGFMTLEMPAPLAPAPRAAGGGAGHPEPELRVLPRRETVAMRIREPMATVDVGALVDRALPAVGAWARAAGLELDGPPYVRYHDWGATTADLEIGFPVRDGAPGREPGTEPGWEPGPAGEPVPVGAPLPAGEPGRSELPGGRFVVLVHLGPYQGLPASWGRLTTWAWDQGLEPAGPVWESYVDNPDLVDPAILRTEVIRPVRG